MVQADILETQESVAANENIELVENICYENPISNDVPVTFDGVDYTVEEDDNDGVDPAVFGEESEHINIGEGDEHVPHEWDDGADMFVGQVFESKQAVQDVIEVVSHASCFEFRIIKSNPKTYVVKCREANNGCNWRFRAAEDKHSSCFSVRTYKKIHNCSRISTSTSRNRRKGTARMVAALLNEDYPGQSSTPAPKALQNMVQSRLGVAVSYCTAWRGRNLAIENVRGRPAESYELLCSYTYMLEVLNPGTRSRVELDANNKFKYLFFALGACIEGFSVMRKVIIVDATFLKNSYGGVLIVATAQDPNRHNYPIAFGVVDSENDDSWKWFMTTLKTVVPDSSELVFVSDRNRSIIKSIGEVYPNSQHGYCIYHLSQNVKSHVIGSVKKVVAAQFMECAQAYSESRFRKLYTTFRETYPTAAIYLDQSVDVQKWAKCYFPGERYNIDTSNCVESINAVLREARKMSLLPMLDVIVGKVAEWFNKHRKSAAEIPPTHRVVPLLEIEFHTNCMLAQRFRVDALNTSRGEYSVIGEKGRNSLVDLTRRTCSCKRFDIDRYTFALTN